MPVSGHDTKLFLLIVSYSFIAFGKLGLLGQALDMGDDAMPAIPFLARLSASDRDMFVRKVAIMTLEGMATKDDTASNAVSNALKSSDPVMRKLATEAFKSGLRGGIPLGF
jgi:hypothetical protein